MSFKNVHFVINPAAGKPEPVLHVINRVLQGQDIEWNVSLTRRDGSGQEQAQAAIQAGADLVVAYGGDGTVKDVMNGMIGTTVPMAILHGGTGNALAHELKIPTDLREAVSLILDGHIRRPVDVGHVINDSQPDNPGHFMLRASIGMQTNILETANRELKDRFGNLAYVIASLRALSGSEARTYPITIDGQQVEGTGLTCMITNSASVGGANSFVFTPDVDPSDGLLDVLILDTNFESLLAVVGGALHVGNPSLSQHWKGREIRVAGDESQVVTLDGEEHGCTPMTVSVIPHAVEVLVPAAQPEKGG